MTKVLLSALFFLPPGIYLLTVLKRKSAPWVLINAAVFTLFFWFYRYYSQPLFLILGILYSVSALSSFYDFFHKNLLTVHIVLIAAVCTGARFFLNIPIPNTVLSLSSGFLALFIPYLLSNRKWLGSGDILVFSSFCLIVEPYSVPLLLILSALSGILYYLAMKILGKPSDKIPFIPFLSLALFVYYPFQYPIGAALFHY